MVHATRAKTFSGMKNNFLKLQIAVNGKLLSFKCKVVFALEKVFGEFSYGLYCDGGACKLQDFQIVTVNIEFFVVSPGWVVSVLKAQCVAENGQFKIVIT